MDEQRNFRSSYYEKVGCRGVEEKKSLEILLKEKPWDKVKLKNFCLRFTVPVAYRNLVWKVLLGILPIYPDSHEFVMEQRTAQYDDLLHALQVMELVEESAPRSQVLYAMWQLESGWIRPYFFPETKYSSQDTFIPIATTLQELYSSEVDVYWMAKGLSETVGSWQRGLFKLQDAFSTMLEKEDSQDTFIPIATTLQELYSSEVDVYWMAKGLSETVGSWQRDLLKLQDAFSTMLEKEDVELYNYLIDINAMDVLPLMKWFNCCFAGVLDDTSLAKIWDKICGGAPKILSFVAVMLVITLRWNILKAENSEEVLKCVSEIPEQCEDVVANKAIELWQYYGAQPQSDQMVKK